VFDISWNLPQGTENNHETLQSGYPASSQNPVPQQYTADPKYINNQKMQLNIYYVFYSQNSRPHVSAGIMDILRVMFLYNNNVVNLLTLELNPSAQRCLPRFFYWGF
jgi:hypothetical protein